MPNSINKKHINVDKDLIDRFDYIYPKIKNTFAYRAFKLALENKDIFELIFFNPLFLEVK